MNRIESIFAARRASGRAALMPFVCGGHPSIESTPPVLHAAARAGASILEVGFPFSDPIADGPVIAEAMHAALRAGVTPAAVFASAARARREGLSAGLVAMVSMSLVHRAGAARFAKDAASAGFDGLIVPDVPAEEAPSIAGAARDAGLTLSLLVAPTTPADRAARIASACTGFVYLLARVGITGESGGGIETRAVAERVAMLRGATDLPIACGFGVSSAEDVRAIVARPGEGGAGADAAIVGSALVKRLGRAAAQGRDPAQEAETFVRGLSLGL